MIKFKFIKYILMKTNQKNKQRKAKRIQKIKEVRRNVEYNTCPNLIGREMNIYMCKRSMCGKAESYTCVVEACVERQ